MDGRTKTALKFDDELMDLLESIPSEPKKDLIEFKSIILDCPACSEKYRVTFDTREVNEKACENGIGNVHLKLSCGHDFIIHVDKSIKARGFTEINSGIHATSEKLDVRYLKEAEVKLSNYHEKLVKIKDDKAFRIFQELKKVRKEIAGLS